MKILKPDGLVEVISYIFIYIVYKLYDIDLWQCILLHIEGQLID